MLVAINGFYLLLVTSLLLLFDGSEPIFSLIILLVMSIFHLPLSWIFCLRRLKFSRLIPISNLILDFSYITFLISIWLEYSLSNLTPIASSFQFVSFSYLSLRSSISIVFSGYFTPLNPNPATISSHYSFYNRYQQDLFCQRQLKRGILSLLVFTILVLLMVFLNLAGMGKTLTLLPFKITGILNYFLWDGLPFLYVIPLLNLVRAQSRSIYVNLYLFATVIAGLISSISLGSRGYLINIIIVYILGIQLVQLRPTIRKYYSELLNKFTGISIFLAVLLSFIRSYSYDRSINFSILTQFDFSPEIFGTFATKILERGFSLFITLYKYSVEEFSNVDVSSIVSYRGFARFHTQVIDGFSEDAFHSSGSTTLADSFLVLGPLGIIISIISIISLLYFISKVASRSKFKSSVLILYLQFTFLQFLLDSSIWEFLFFRQSKVLFVLLFCLFLEFVYRKIYNHS